MYRLFVALRPPRPMREALRAIMGTIEGVRWQDDGQLHLTLRYIGEVDRHSARDIAAALGSVSHPGFDLRLNGIGSFDRRGRIDTIWAGVTPHDQVRSLHGAVSSALARAGIAPDRRAFVPHITLARFSRQSLSAETLPMERLWPPPAVARFDHFFLYESVLSASGSNYSAIGRYALG